MLGGIEQRLVFVLAVQVDELAPEFPQRRRRGERVVDERAAAALRRDLPSHDHLAAVRPLEDRLNRRGLLAGAHEVARWRGRR